MDLTSIRKSRHAQYRRNHVIDNWIVLVVAVAFLVALSHSDRAWQSGGSLEKSVLIRATQTAEVARAGATGEALAHAAETSSATTDITAILDEDPTVVGPIEAVALQLHAVSPLARGLRYQESFKVVVAGKHSSIPKGSIVTLRCGDDPSQLLCVVIAVVTPVP